MDMPNTGGVWTRDPKTRRLKAGAPQIAEPEPESTSAPADDPADDAGATDQATPNRQKKGR